MVVSELFFSEYSTDVWHWDLDSQDNYYYSRYFKYPILDISIPLINILENQKLIAFEEVVLECSTIVMSVEVKETISSCKSLLKIYGPKLS